MARFQIVLGDMNELLKMKDIFEVAFYKQVACVLLKPQWDAEGDLSRIRSFEEHVPEGIPLFVFIEWRQNSVALIEESHQAFVITAQGLQRLKGST